MLLNLIYQQQLRKLSTKLAEIMQKFTIKKSIRQVPQNNRPESPDAKSAVAWQPLSDSVKLPKKSSRGAET